MKKFWRSKTLWVNALTVVGGIVAKVSGYVLSGEELAVILGVVNMVLRIVTKEGLSA